jgi:lipoprotein-anchoring transpeptidase ErfK/SrfK
MNTSVRHSASLGCVLMAFALLACVQKAPPELVQAVESLDRQLTAEQGAEFAPEEYARFIKSWVALKGRLLTDEELIRWPWEPDTLVADLQRVQEEGIQAASAAAQRREAGRLEAEARLQALERRLVRFNSSVDEMGSRVVLGPRPMETELLAKQARTFFNQGLYARSLESSQAAADLLTKQAATLTAELGRYGDERNVAAWRRMVQRTVAWSKMHRAAAIVVTKADRRLILYRNGHQVLSYPVRLGYNGVMEKRYQGDGATPEGEYRVIRKRDRGQTRFYRALLLDYPNPEDRRRFRAAVTRGTIPAEAFIGGEIEIHGGEGGNETTLSQTLGCVMLENRQIDALFQHAETGTPVTIVGALKIDNSVSLGLASLERDDEEEEDEETASSQAVSVSQVES